MSEGSVNTLVSFNRHIQFNQRKISIDSSSSDDTEKSSTLTTSEPDDNVNERLRHQLPDLDFFEPTKYLDRLLTSVCSTIVYKCLQEVSILRELNNIPLEDVNLNYIPLDEKYKMTEHDIGTILNEDKNFLVCKKFKRDISWLEKVLTILLIDIQKTFYYEKLLTILNDVQYTKQEEETLLTSKEFNKREVQKLRYYIENERKELTRGVQVITEEMGNAKDELNDNIVENLVKISYVKDWEKSRNEQNHMILENKENRYLNTTKCMKEKMNKENRVHEELWSYLEISMNEYKAEIEKWMDEYDRDLEEKEQQVQLKKIDLERQRDQYTELLAEYNSRQQQIDDYKAYKLQKQKEVEELERMTRAAIRIQAWWRGVMFRKGLGPFRRKKGKGKKGGSAKNSAKKTKK